MHDTQQMWHWPTTSVIATATDLSLHFINNFLEYGVSTWVFFIFYYFCNSSGWFKSCCSTRSGYNFSWWYNTASGICCLCCLDTASHGCNLHCHQRASKSLRCTHWSCATACWQFEETRNNSGWLHHPKWSQGIESSLPWSGSRVQRLWESGCVLIPTSRSRNSESSFGNQGL